MIKVKPKLMLLFEYSSLVFDQLPLLWRFLLVTGSRASSKGVVGHVHELDSHILELAEPIARLYSHHALCVAFSSR